MSLLFRGAVTSSPIRKRQPVADQSCHSLDLSLLSPDSSYECFSVDPVTGSPCSCRRSPRLLSNGYYQVTEDSYAWDEQGNVSLTLSNTSVSYKENLVRVFRRRRRRARRSLASLLSGVTESCQSWLGERVFGGAPPPAPLAESSWLGEETTTTDLEDTSSFLYDHSEIVSPPDKMAPEPVLQEPIRTETCLPQDQSLSGLLDVPPPSTFSSNQYRPPKPQPAEFTVLKPVLLLILAVFIFTSIFSRCLVQGLAMVFITLALIMTSLYLTRTGPMGRWRRARTEDITSANE